ncbi:unannotated protein [freshwater metagenome]|uniref:Unannotated protein n=1 Tax=freshwater metagenome TaxID=449393 RepID=A0A6J7S510_9ZZZZ
MVGLDDRGVDRPAVPSRQAERSQLVVAVKRVADERGRAERFERGSYAEDATERRFLDSAAVSGAQHQYSGALKPTKRLLKPLGGVSRHLVVYGPCGAWKRRIGVTFEVEAGIDRDAVATDRDSRAVNVAEGLTVGRLNHALDVNPFAVCEACQLIGEGDVDVTVGRFGELDHLGRLGRTHRPHFGFEERSVQLYAARLTGRAEAAKQLRICSEIGEDTAAENSFGAEDGEEVLLGGQPAGG